MPIIEIFQVIREWVTSKAPGNPCEQFSDIRKLGSNLWKKVMIDNFLRHFRHVRQRFSRKQFFFITHLTQYPLQHICRNELARSSDTRYVFYLLHCVIWRYA